MSAWRTDAWSREATCFKHLVACEVPERVVHGLEVVEVAEHHRQGPVITALAFEGVIQAVGEKHAVDEPGERVVERLAGEVHLAGFELGRPWTRVCG